MTTMDLKKILSQPESKVLEFKRDLSSLAPILKTIVAFANTAGGTLVIGRSTEGKLIGIDDVFKAEESLANAIADSIRPALLPEIEIATIDAKDLLIIKVSHWKAPSTHSRDLRYALPEHLNLDILPPQKLCHTKKFHALR